MSGAVGDNVLAGALDRVAGGVGLGLHGHGQGRSGVAGIGSRELDGAVTEWCCGDGRGLVPVDHRARAAGHGSGRCGGFGCRYFSCELANGKGDENPVLGADSPQYIAVDIIYLDVFDPAALEYIGVKVGVAAYIGGIRPGLAETVGCGLNRIGGSGEHEHQTCEQRNTLKDSVHDQSPFDGDVAPEWWAAGA